MTTKAKKVGSMYVVEHKSQLNFEEIRAVIVDFRQCGVGEFSVIYTDDKEQQGFFIEGGTESNNQPVVGTYSSTGAVRIVVEQPHQHARGMLYITLGLPRNKKLNGLTAMARNMSYNISETAEIARVNLSNKEGEIDINVKSNMVNLYSRYSPVNAVIEITETNVALVQVGSRVENVNLTLHNASKINVKRMPPRQQYSYNARTCPDGYPVDVFLEENVDGDYTIQ